MEACPDGLDRKGLDLSDFLAAITLDFEEDECSPPLFAHSREDRLEDLSLLAFPNEMKDVGARMGQIAHGPTFAEEATQPGAPAVVAHRTLRNPIEKTREIAAVERVELAAQDDENLLGEVLDIRFVCAERPNPACDV